MPQGPSASFDRDGFDHLLTWVQDGVVARWQLRDLRAEPHEIRRMLRRGELHLHHPGIYVDHNGPLTWEQRAWAAVLHHWPAALDRASALPDPPRGGPIQVAIGLHRTIRPMPHVIARPTADLEARTRPRSAPPRLMIEHAVLNVVLATDDVAAQFRALADAVRSRETSAAAITAALGSRGRVPGRRRLRALLDDLADGAQSVLEREWLRLERAHALPSGQRQRPERPGGRPVERDVRYPGFDLLVELDGAAFHEDAEARDRDHERDLDTAVDSGDLTIRLTYGQVFTRGCRTAFRVAQLLRGRGWRGTFVPCPACPDEVRSGATMWHRSTP